MGHNRESLWRFLDVVEWILCALFGGIFHFTSVQLFNARLIDRVWWTSVVRSIASRWRRKMYCYRFTTSIYLQLWRHLSDLKQMRGDCPWVLGLSSGLDCWACLASLCFLHKCSWWFFVLLWPPMSELFLKVASHSIINLIKETGFYQQI